MACWKRVHGSSARTCIFPMRDVSQAGTQASRDTCNGRRLGTFLQQSGLYRGSVAAVARRLPQEPPVQDRASPGCLWR